MLSTLTQRMADTKGRTACIVSLTPVTDEPRVNRQCRALYEAGWNVVVAGYKGRSEKPPYWRLIEVEKLPPALSRRRRWGLALKKTLSPYVASYAEDYYWWSADYAGIYERLAWVEGVRCNLAVAHDFFTAPIAAKLADHCGGTFVLDCHEYSVAQYAHDPRWVRYERPWVDALQRRYIEKAAVVTTVCEGIARLLQDDYSMPVPPLVVRSVPFYQPFPLRPAGEQLDVLYQGLVCPNRGLELTIQSVPLWRGEFRFLIRGPGPETYIASLIRLAEKHGVSKRVRFESPVPFPDIVRAAHAADIGFFVQEDVSLHKHYALPNKFFDYIMAGTALCVADLPEMARVVERYGVGRLVQRPTPQGIAEVINGFSREEIDACKRRSLQAAKELCWENESKVMMAAYERVVA